LNPQTGKLLLSFEKGWMVYTPLAFLSLVGFIKLFRENTYRAVFLFLTFFVLAYVLSCWWVWHYTSQFGQRVFIDFYGLMAVLLLMGYALFERRILKRLYKVLIFFFVFLNLFQFYQHLTWVYPAGPVTARTYIRNFLRLAPQMAVMIPEKAIQARYTYGFSFDVASAESRIIASAPYQTHAIEPYRPFRLGALPYGHIAAEKHCLLKVNTKIWGCADSVLNLQFDFFSEGKKYSEYTFNMSRYLRCRQANDIEAVVYLPMRFHPEDSVRVSLQSPAAYEVAVENVQLEILVLKQGYDLRWITKPLNSAVSVREFYCNMDDCDGHFNLPQRSDTMALTGKYSSAINRRHPYGAGFKMAAGDVFSGLNRAMKISASTYSDFPVRDARLVVSVLKNSTIVYYQAIPLDMGQDTGIWKHHHHTIALPFLPDENLEVNIYFWDADPVSPWFVDEMNLYFFTLAQREIPSVQKRLAEAQGSEQVFSMPDITALYAGREFYGPAEFQLADLANCRPASLLVQASVKPDCWFPSAALVVAHYSADSLVDYRAEYFATHTRKDRWERIIFEYPLGPCHAAGDVLRVYFWNPAGEERLLLAGFEGIVF
jgi:hypothetical protein